MFTTEPSLTQRIGRMIGDIAIVDAQARIRPDRPGATDLAALMGDPHLLADLAAVGMPADTFEASLPADEQVLRSLPYLRRIRNTSAAWCLYRIFRDIYDFDEPHLDATNYRPLFDKVAASAQEPAWARTILVDRAKVRLIATCLDLKGDGPSPIAEQVVYIADAHWAAPASLKNLSGYLGEVPDSIERLDQLVGGWLDRKTASSTPMVALPMPHRFRLEMMTSPRMNQTWAGLAQKNPGGDSDEQYRAMTLMRAFFRWHEARGRTLRFTDPLGGPVWSRAQGLDILSDVLPHFPKARFDLVLGWANDRALSDLAGRLPNLTVSGNCWRNASAHSIAETLGHRIQAVPAVKISGFSSDASSVEWVYGRLQFVKKAMGSAFARLIEEGFFEEDEVPPLLRTILNETPSRILGLDPQS